MTLGILSWSPPCRLFMGSRWVSRKGGKGLVELLEVEQMNKQVQLNLVVIRSAQAAGLAEFYSLLGLQWEYHRHGSGPWHYSAKCAGLLLEIYPLKEDTDEVDTSLRLGFRVEDLDDLLSKLQKSGITIKVPAKQGSWGYRAVVEDVEGRRLELVEQ